MIHALHTAIDLATPDQLARHCTEHSALVTGTPRECWDWAKGYFYGLVIHN